MPAYLIINYKVEDPALYGEYAQAAGPAIKIGSECELVAMDPATEQLEGEGAGHQTIVLRFESKQKAKALYHSGEYQAVIGKRHQATSHHFAVLVEGLS